MKQVKIILILIICSFKIYGQSFSLSIDSLTNNYIQLLPEKQQSYFDKILKERRNVKWLNRIDSKKYDYAFIEETVCFFDTTSVITERYFLASDSIPKYVYENGEQSNVNAIYCQEFIWYSKNVIYYQTLFPLISNYSW